MQKDEDADHEAFTVKSYVTGESQRVKTVLSRYWRSRYGLQKRPDLQFLCDVLLTLLSIWCINYLYQKYCTSTYHKQFWGRPLNEADMLQIRMHGQNLQAHREYFALSIFSPNILEDVLMIVNSVQGCVTGIVVGILTIIFIISYVLWFIITYLVFIIKATLTFLCDVVFRFLLDYAMWQIKYIVADIVIKAVTFGRGRAKQGKAPLFATYLAKWRKNVIDPWMDRQQKIYGAKLKARTQQVDTLIKVLMLPYRFIVKLIYDVKRTFFELPFKLFKYSIITTYPAFVKEQASLVTAKANIQANQKAFANTAESRLEDISATGRSVSKWIWILAIILALIIAFAGGYIYWRRRRHVLSITQYM